MRGKSWNMKRHLKPIGYLKRHKSMILVMKLQLGDRFGVLVSSSRAAPVIRIFK
jgi:hypothetical protein